MKTLVQPAKKINVLAVLFSLSLLGACASQHGTASSADRDAVAAMSKAGKDYFDEKCKTVAGEKIYRTVQDVEGLVLLKLRPQPTETQLEDPMWPGAAFAIEAYEDSYITSFLGYEYAAGNINNTPAVVTPNKRGYISTDKRPGGLPGYRYVDVIDARDGQRVRIKGVWKVTGRKDVTAYNVKVELDKNPNYDLNVYSYVLDKTPTTAPPPPIWRDLRRPRCPRRACHGRCQQHSQGAGPDHQRSARRDDSLCLEATGHTSD